ncbi:MAG: T9SS type A sorting domain-containing protein [Bacteroidia bacterium]
MSPSGKVYLATNGSSWVNTNPFTHSIIELSNDAYVAPTSIDEAKPSAEIVSVSPNPVALGQALTITLTQVDQARFELYDFSGRLMLKKQVFGSQDINLDVEAGVYVYKITGDNGRLTAGKLVVR